MTAEFPNGAPLIVQLPGIPQPPVSPVGSGWIYFDGNVFKVSQSGNPFVNLVGGGGSTYPIAPSGSSATTSDSVTSFAAGQSAAVTGSQSVAVGATSSASSANCLAMGFGASSNGTMSVAVGANTLAAGASDTVVGEGSNTDASGNTVTVGFTASSLGGRNVVIGSLATSILNDNVIIGYSASGGSNSGGSASSKSVVIGSTASLPPGLGINYYAELSTVIGYGANVPQYPLRCVVVGANTGADNLGQRYNITPIAIGGGYTAYNPTGASGDGTYTASGIIIGTGQDLGGNVTMGYNVYTTSTFNDSIVIANTSGSGWSTPASGLSNIFLGSGYYSGTVSMNNTFIAGGNNGSPITDVFFGSGPGASSVGNGVAEYTIHGSGGNPTFGNGASLNLAGGMGWSAGNAGGEVRLQVALNGAATTLVTSLIVSNPAPAAGAATGWVAVGNSEPRAHLDAQGTTASQGLTLTTSTVLDNTSATDATYFAVDATTGMVIVTLPAISTCINRVYKFVKKDASPNTVSIAGNGADTINGSPTFGLLAQYNTAEVWNDGSQWYVF